MTNVCNNLQENFANKKEGQYVQVQARKENQSAG